VVRRFTSLAMLLEERAAAHGDRVAMVTPEGEVPYHALATGARRVSARLAAAGVAAGARVAISLPNGRAFVESWFGALGIGATVVPLPIGSTAAELRFRLERARCQALLGDAPSAVAQLPGLRHLPHPELGADERQPQDARADETAMILYTSATTGAPRGVRLSHGSLSAHTATLVRHSLTLDEGDRVLGVLPLAHSFGCRLAMLAPLFAGRG
jgi:long-chain acyl-CoA synthetase